MATLGDPNLPVVSVLDLADVTAAEWDAVAIPLAPGEDGVQPRRGTADVGARYGVDLADLAELAGVTGKAGEVVAVPLPHLLAGASAWDTLPRRLVLVGVGDGTPAALRTAGASLARAARGWGRVATTVPLTALPPGRAASSATEDDGAVTFLIGALLGDYVAYRSKSTPTEPRLTRLGLITLPGMDAGAAAALGAAAEFARALAGGTAIARTLAATPAATATPEWIAAQGRALVAELSAESTGDGRALDLSIDVHERRWLAEHGFGGVLAVGQGAEHQPRVVVVSYDGRAGTRRKPHGPTVAVVGKGITFDSGGLSKKPPEAMITMKTDMTGAAVALATVVTAARLRLPVRVVAVLALAENAFSGSAYRPGDVVTVYDGTTVEIGNTDAEGRMVLADALGFAAQEIAPDVLVDVATLTGAAGISLGRGIGALFTPDAELAAALTRAGERAGEPVWRMPLVPDYRDAITSTVADVSQIATDPNVKSGTITAALFLERFTDGLPWAHLDIAGPARADKARSEVPGGPTGFGVRLLVRWLQTLG